MVSFNFLFLFAALKNPQIARPPAIINIAPKNKNEVAKIAGTNIPYINIPRPIAKRGMAIMIPIIFKRPRLAVS